MKAQLAVKEHGPEGGSGDAKCFEKYLIIWWIIGAREQENRTGFVSLPP